MTNRQYLISKYGIIPKIKGKIYQDLMTKIIADNHENTQKQIGKLEQSHWNKALKKITKKEKQFILPDITDVLPNRKVFIRKGAEQGKLITNTLKEKLSQDLRRTLEGKEIKVISRRGRTAGVINPKVIKEFKDNITQTFSEYTKKGKGIPTNIETIARTEIRTAVSDIKSTYMKSIADSNPELSIKKKWIHNSKLSKKPRLGHIKMGLSPAIPFNENYNVPVYVIRGNRWEFRGYVSMKHPHDKNAPVDQVINCTCQEIYITEKK